MAHVMRSVVIPRSAGVARTVLAIMAAVNIVEVQTVRTVAATAIGIARRIGIAQTDAALLTMAGEAEAARHADLTDVVLG
jgi:hypothetical protein